MLRFGRARALHFSTTSRGPNRPVFPYKVGEICHGFKLEKTDFIHEYSLRTLQLQHLETGASYFHIDTDDTNNVFSINFRTPSSDSTGIAHVLEHTVLCGSERFPIRDPFFNMLKRSLNTYMNAMTASDHTMYPFATINYQDMINLRSVYLDAVFFPLLLEDDFLQEGSRIDVKEGSEELIFKGVVYNEMKGVLADNNNLYGTRMQQLLFPDSIYGVVSGGDPVEIPNLTIDRLREFHRQFYHPSNCQFFTYGDFPLEGHLEYINDEILKRFKFQSESSNVTIQPVKRFNEPIRQEIECSPDTTSIPVDQQLRICKTMVVGDSRNVHESLVLRLLSYLLLNGPSSPMYQSLIETNLGKDFSVGTGFDSSTIDSTFGIGLQGVSEENLEKVEKEMMHTLQEIAAKGFDPVRVDALIHQIELGQKHIVGNFGMRLLQSISSAWCHRGDPVDGLQVNYHLDILRESIKTNSKFWQDQIQRFILDATHSATVVMRPNQDFGTMQLEKESESLAEIRSGMENDEIQALKERNRQLNEYQERKQDASCLPSMTVADIPREISIGSKIINESVDGISVQCVETRTNELCYVRGAFDTSKLPTELKPYLPIFAAAVTQLGTSKYNHRTLATELERACGGISFSPAVLRHLGSNAYDEKLLIETMCLPGKLSSTFNLLGDISMTADFDNLGQLANIILMAANAADGSIANSGHSLAKLYSSAQLHEADNLDEQFSGFTQLTLLREMVAMISNESGGLDHNGLKKIAQKLRAIANILFTTENVKWSIVTEPQHRDETLSCISEMMNQLPAAQQQHQCSSTWLRQDTNKPGTFFSAPISVNFVVESFPTVPLLHQDNSSLTMLGQVLQSCFLHQEIREKGGAYGAQAAQGSQSFSMASYFDPHTHNTLKAYESSLDRIKSGDFQLQDVDEAKLAVFGGVDAPVPPSAKGRGAFLYGITDEIRQLNRDRLLRVSKSDIVNVAQKYFDKTSAVRAIVGMPEHAKSFEKEGWIIKSV